MADAARQAGRPSWLLLAGLLYPTVLLVFDLPVFHSASEALLTNDWQDGYYSRNMDASMAFSLTFVFLVLFPLMRLVPGLATVTSPTVWNQFVARGTTPGLRDAHRAGKGLWSSATGLYLQTFLMLGMGFLICLGPAALGLTLLGFDEDLIPIVLLPILAFVLFYALVLAVLYQLSLQSLAQNRRGVGSAMQHAWRLMQAHPWAVGRTLLVDTVLFLTVALMTTLLTYLASTCVLIPIVVPLIVALSGFVGVARAGFWSRAYRSLGGITQEDGLPGLPRASLPPA